MKKTILTTVMILISFFTWGQTSKCDWSKQGIYYSNKCNTYTFELGSKDTCVSYITYIKNLRIKDYPIKNYEGRIFKHVFQDSGEFLIKTIFKNKCTNCDTFIYKEIRVTCKEPEIGEINKLNIIKQTPINFYPNPTSNELSFEYEGEVVEVIIYNYLGKVVYTGNSTQNQINTELWPSGYFTIKFGNSINRLYIIK